MTTRKKRKTNVELHFERLMKEPGFRKAWAKEKKRKHCSQCGEPFTSQPCGFSHAELYIPPKKRKRISEPDWLDAFVCEIFNILCTMPEVGVWRLKRPQRLINSRKATIRSGGGN